MDNKLIFLDVDGTLTLPGRNDPPESALRAIRAAQACGHKVFLCSGRNCDMLRPLLRYGVDGAVASSGGGSTEKCFEQLKKAAKADSFAAELSLVEPKTIPSAEKDRQILGFAEALKQV